MRQFPLALAASCALAVGAGCANADDPQTVSAGQPAVTISRVDRSSDQVDWRPQLPIPESGHVPGPDGYQMVGTVLQDGSFRKAEGFLRNTDWIPGRHGPVAPVYDQEGRKIAYWGLNVGWIDRAVAEAPDFDYEELRIKTDAAAKAHQKQLEELEADR